MGVGVLHADERGSIVAVSDDAGATLALNRYDENGIPQAGNIGRFQYTGQKWLRGLGLYDYKARMYSPTLGRFLQTDPIGYGDGMNPYAYVGNDPVNAVDPSGTECEKGRQTSDNGQPCDIVVNGAVPGDNPLPPPEFHFDPDWGDFSRLVTVPRTPGLAKAPQSEKGDIVVIAYNGYRHNQVVRDIADKLRRDGNTVATEFQLCLTGTTICTRADILFRYRQNGFIYAIDVKSGPGSRFTGNQTVIYPHLITGGLVSTFDPRAVNFGLPLGALPPIIGMGLYEASPGSPIAPIPWPGGR